jgi:hypothetical protein
MNPLYDGAYVYGSFSINIMDEMLTLYTIRL